MNSLQGSSHPQPSLVEYLVGHRGGGRTLRTPPNPWNASKADEKAHYSWDYPNRHCQRWIPEFLLCKYQRLNGKSDNSTWWKRDWQSLFYLISHSCSPSPQMIFNSVLHVSDGQTHWDCSTYSLVVLLFSSYQSQWRKFLQLFFVPLIFRSYPASCFRYYWAN